jgi:hypothetical protein
MALHRARDLLMARHLQQSSTGHRGVYSFGRDRLDAFPAGRHRTAAVVKSSLRDALLDVGRAAVVFLWALIGAGILAAGAWSTRGP